MQREQLLGLQLQEQQRQAVGQQLEVELQEARPVRVLQQLAPQPEAQLAPQLGLLRPVLAQRLRLNLSQ
jgi:hypothetical protein